MELAPYIVAYAAILVFVLVCIRRTLMWLKMPMHVRWELYPVAHEGKRAAHGGSYLEETDWWTKPRTRSLWGELKVMVPEILFLVALKEHNRSLWLRSFPFHLGLYLASIAAILMLLGGILGALVPSFLESAFAAAVLDWVVPILGYAGLGLGLLGALGLLQRRLTEPVMRDFTSPGDWFNLTSFVVVFGFALATQLVADPGFAATRSLMAGLVTFDMTPVAESGPAVWMLPTAGVLLILLLAYIPMTHMSHFIGKYFAYHAIRWDDAPNFDDKKREAKIEKLLGQKVSWSAPHIQGEGKKDWVELALDKNPEQKES